MQYIPPQLLTSYRAYNKALCEVKGKFPKGEEEISKSADCSYLYSKNVLKGRFCLGESVISSDLHIKKLYEYEMNKILSNEELLLFKLEF